MRVRKFSSFISESKYAGQRKVEKDIERKLKREQGRSEESKKKANDKAALLYYSKLHKKNLDNDNQGPLGAFRRKVRGMTLKHATSKAKAQAIKSEGFSGRYNYFSEFGWGDERDNSRNYVVSVKGSSVAEMAYPDPEDFWGSDVRQESFAISMESLINKYGIEEVEARIKEWLSSNPEALDNIVVVGEIPATLVDGIGKYSEW